MPTARADRKHLEILCKDVAERYQSSRSVEDALKRGNVCAETTAALEDLNYGDGSGEVEVTEAEWRNTIKKMEFECLAC